MKKNIILLLLCVFSCNSAFCKTHIFEKNNLLYETLIVSKITLNTFKISFNNLDYTQKIVCYFLKKENEAIKYETKKLITDATICALDLINSLNKIKLTNISCNRWFSSSIRTWKINKSFSISHSALEISVLRCKTNFLIA